MSPEFMLVLSLLFLGGVVVVPIASKLGLGSVLGYLIAGIVLTPILSFVGVDIVELQHFAEFGVVMMLFLVGLEMSPKALWDMRARIFILGGLQVLGTTLIAAIVAMLLDQPWSVGIAIGMVLSLSSTAIVNQTLSEKGLLKSDGGHASFSVLLFQDIAVIPMLVFLPLLALPELMELQHNVITVSSHDGETGLHLSIVDGLNGWQTALVSLVAIAGVIASGHYLTDPLFRFVSKANLRELFVSTALMLVLAIALLMTLVGLSPALGTFLAGVVMARSEYRHELESDISPFKGIFLGIFFITVGAGINFDLLSNHISSIIGMTLGLIALKAMVLFALAHSFKLTGGDKWLFALGLAQPGEFGFVLLSFTVGNSVIPADVGDKLSLVVALSMLLTPLLFIVYDRVIAPRYSRQEERQMDEIKTSSKVIVAGHGRFGSIANRALTAAGFETTVVDYNSEQLVLHRRFKMPVYFGDVTRPDLLHAAGIEEADILVVAIDDKHSINQLVRYVHKHHPHIRTIARAVDRMHVYTLWNAGCRNIVRETYDSAVRTSRYALQALGLSEEEAGKSMEAFDDIDRKWMLEFADVFDDDKLVIENEAFMARYDETYDAWLDKLKTAMKQAKSDT